MSALHLLKMQHTYNPKLLLFRPVQCPVKIDRLAGVSIVRGDHYMIILIGVLQVCRYVAHYQRQIRCRHRRFLDRFRKLTPFEGRTMIGGGSIIPRGGLFFYDLHASPHGRVTETVRMDLHQRCGDHHDQDR